MIKLFQLIGNQILITQKQLSVLTAQFQFCISTDLVQKKERQRLNLSHNTATRKEVTIFISNEMLTCLLAYCLWLHIYVMNKEEILYEY